MTFYVHVLTKVYKVTFKNFINIYSLFIFLLIKLKLALSVTLVIIIIILASIKLLNLPYIMLIYIAFIFLTRLFSQLSLSNIIPSYQTNFFYGRLNRYCCKMKYKIFVIYVVYYCLKVCHHVCVSLCINECKRLHKAIPIIDYVTIYFKYDVISMLLLTRLLYIELRWIDLT